MKVNQIVGEHKKGYRANIYRKKKVIAPQSTEIKPMEEDAKITKSDQTGVEITADTGIKTVLPADKATALAPDPQNPNEYDLNPAAVNPSDSGTSGPSAPKVGASVEMKTAEDSGDFEAPDVVTLDSADGFKDALRKASAQVGVDEKTMATIDQMVVADADGSVDVKQTIKNTMVLVGDLIPKFVEMYKGLLTAMENATRSPEFAQISPEEKQSIVDAIRDMRMQIPAMERQANDTVAQMKTQRSELDRIQELAGMTDEDVRLGDFTQHDNGDTSYSAGPLSVRKSKDGSTDMTATIGDTTARIQQNPIGVRTMTAQGSAADAISSVDASAERKGVDPAKFAQFRQQAGVQESAELKAMLTIAGLR